MAVETEIVWTGRPVSGGAAARASALPAPQGAVRFRESAPEGWLLRAARYWQARRGERRWPRRADIDPLDIRDLLPGIILLDVVGEPPRFRKRLVGSAIVEKEGVDTTGRWLDDCLNPAIREEVLRQHEQAVRQPEGCCHLIEFAGADGKLYSYQRLLLPLSCDGERVNMLFGGARFLPAVGAWPRAGSAASRLSDLV